MYLTFARKYKCIITLFIERRNQGTQMKLRSKFRHCIMSPPLATTLVISKYYFLSLACTFVKNNPYSHASMFPNDFKMSSHCMNLKSIFRSLLQLYYYRQGNYQVSPGRWRQTSIFSGIKLWIKQKAWKHVMEQDVTTLLSLCL